jgi:hypothetical protein
MELISFAESLPFVNQLGLRESVADFGNYGEGNEFVWKISRRVTECYICEQEG